MSVNVPPQIGAEPVRTATTDPEIRQPPVKPFVYYTVGTAGAAPQATVTLPGAAVKAATGAGLTTIVRLPVMVLLQASTKVHVSVKVPPQVGADPVRTATTDPEIRQPPEPPFVYDTVGTAGTAPQETVTFPGAPVKAAAGAASTVMVRFPVIVLLQISTYVHVSVKVPPHAPALPVRTATTDPASRQLPVPPFV